MGNEPTHQDSKFVDWQTISNYCFICERHTHANDVFFVCVSATQMAGVYLENARIYFPGKCCNRCFEGVQSRESTNSWKNLWIGIALVGAIAITRYIHPDLSLAQAVFLGAFTFAICYGIGKVFYNVCAAPKRPGNNSQIIKHAKQLSREHLRNATPQIEFLTSLPRDVAEGMEELRGH